MNRGHLRFLWARLRRDEAALGEWSCPRAALEDELAGRSVAIVGNARSLAATGHGARIDAADLVIRINRAPMPAARSHGTRTDWLALATRLSPAEEARIDPARILWMSPKRKRLPWRIAARPDFFLYPLAEFEALRGRLQAPPTTGLMIIDFVARSQAAGVSLYGFDFFASLSLTGRRTAAQVPHDFAAERAFVERLIETDPRFRLVTA
jgi:hypothetical protein